MKDLICIMCPKGCHLKVDEEHGYTVTGNRCPRDVYKRQLSDFAEQTEYPLLADLRAQLEKVAARYSTDGAFDYDAALAAHLKAVSYTHLPGGGGGQSGL